LSLTGYQNPNKSMRYVCEMCARNDGSPIAAQIHTAFLAAKVILSLAGVSVPVQAADVAAGIPFFQKCAACHTVSAGTHKIGPSPSGPFGRRAATASDFKRYSKSMSSAGARGLVWNEGVFLQYIGNPNQFLCDFLGNPTARSTMTFAGIRKQNDRENILAYLLEATM
jgi:cytochrome c